MSKLTNMYYAQYASSTESEPAYDSDNSDTYRKLLESPSYERFRRYIECRNNENLLHASWKRIICEQTDLVQKVEEQCGMNVVLAKNRVRYIYRPVLDEVGIKGIKYRITLVYVKLLRKWYISLGRSRLPEVIKLDNKIRNGVYCPIGSTVLSMVRKVKSLLEVFVEKLKYMCKMVDNAKKNYKDIEFQINEPFTNVKIILKERAWPANLEKTSPDDIIILELILDTNLQTVDVAYEFVHSKNVSEELKKICLSKLEEKLQIFFDLPLAEAFITFMNE